jgi:glycosyltransferase involved in cell wall biosynthesis
MAHHNRAQLLMQTLQAIAVMQAGSEIEVCVVDDNSDEGQGFEETTEACAEILESAGMTLRWSVLNYEIDPALWFGENSRIRNPSRAMNEAILMATGEIIVVCGAETFLLGPLEPHLDQLSLRPNTYWSFKCYRTTRDQEALNQLNWLDPELKDDITPLLLTNRSAGMLTWYVHRVHRPIPFHFFGVMKREAMARLRGFDERFMGGLGYDDNDFLARLQIGKFDVGIYMHALAVHQDHRGPDYYSQRGAQPGFTWAHKLHKELGDTRPVGANPDDPRWDAWAAL